MRARSAITGSPPISLPSTSGSVAGWRLEFAADSISRRYDHLALGVGQFDADHVAARHGGDARRDSAHRARDVVGQTDDAAGLDARRRFQLVHRDDRAGADLGDLALHAEIVEHGFQQPRILLQRFLRSARRRGAPAPRSAGRAAAASTTRRAGRARVVPAGARRLSAGLARRRSAWSGRGGSVPGRTSPPWPGSGAGGALGLGGTAAAASSAARSMVPSGTEGSRRHSPPALRPARRNGLAMRANRPGRAGAGGSSSSSGSGRRSAAAPDRATPPPPARRPRPRGPRRPPPRAPRRAIRPPSARRR